MKTSHPYEFLIRWDQQGNLAGAHVVWREVYTEDGEIITERMSDAQPVAIGQAEGFPLASVLDLALVDALEGLDGAAVALAERDATIAGLEATIAALVAEAQPAAA